MTENEYGVDPVVKARAELEAHYSGEMVITDLARLVELLETDRDALKVDLEDADKWANHYHALWAKQQDKLAEIAYILAISLNAGGGKIE